MNLSEWNRSRQNLPALQRLMEFFRDVVLEKVFDKIIISQTASREDSNLNFMGDWLKGNKKLGLKVFKLYRRIRQGKPIADAPLSPVQNHLKLFRRRSKPTSRADVSS